MNPGAGGGPVRVGVIGADGRMGRCVCAVLKETADLQLALGPQFGRAGNAAGNALSSVDPSSVDVFVEFTTADAIADLARTLPPLSKPWVSGTTGLDERGQAALREAARSIPVLWSPNMSVGVAVLSRLLADAARLLPVLWEMELVETHHIAKRDAPSGTALALASRWTDVRGGSLRHGRAGVTGTRPAGEVGVHALRLPEVVGEHRIHLGGPHETLELGHRALDRSAFALGALAAVPWLVQRKAGLYSMEDWAEDRLRSLRRQS